MIISAFILGFIIAFVAVTFIWVLELEGPKFWVANALLTKKSREEKIARLKARRKELLDLATECHNASKALGMFSPRGDLYYDRYYKATQRAKKIDERLLSLGCTDVE